jgi:hypothetical protein
VKRIDGEFRKSFPKSKTIQINVSGVDTLYKLTDMTKTPLKAGSIQIETIRGRMMTVEVIEEDLTFTAYRVNSDSYRSVYWHGTPGNSILHVWINEKTEIDMEVLVQYEDLRL